MDITTERRLLQVTVACVCLVPIIAGGMGVLTGFGLWQGQPTEIDNHIRYLSGLLLGIGLFFAGSLPRIEQLAKPYRLLTFVIVTGAVGRIAGLLQGDPVEAGTLVPLAIELLLVPLICRWQNGYARRFMGLCGDRRHII